MFNIVCGTYEGAIHGYVVDVNSHKVKKKSESSDNNFKPNPLKITKIFSYAPHQGCVKSLISNEDWLVSSSTDECLKAYDLELRKEMGVITRSEGLVTCMDFYKNTHLLCGTEKGDILVWKCKKWDQLKSLEGHKDRINSISIHPSGVLCLSTSKDKTLKLWDLTNGQCVHTSKLGQEADIVLWSPDGSKYILTFNAKLNIYDKNGKKLKSIDNNKYRIISVAWLNEKSFCYGGEDRVISLYETENFEKLHELTGFQNRVKGISVIQKEVNGDDVPLPYLISISSDEYLRIWDLEEDLENPLIEERLEGFRLTFLTASKCKVSEDDNEEDVQKEDNFDVQSNNKKRKRSNKQ